MYDVAIIGAGIIGTSIARALSRYQLSVIVFEKENDVSMGATKANSAIVHGGFAESHAKVKGGLCYKGRKQFDQLNEELHFGFDKIGSLVLAFEDDQLAKLKELYENGLANGLDDLEIIDHDQIMAMEPNVNPDVKYALYCKGAGVCSPYEMAIALAENAVENGVEPALNTEIIDIVKTPDGFELTDHNQKKYAAHYVINAGGVCSDTIARMVGIDNFTITPRSGEYLLMVRGSANIINNVLFQMPTKMGKGILVTPTFYGNLLIGPDAVNEDIADKSTHSERLLKIFNEAKHTTDKLNIKQFIRSYTGIRAVSSTDDFIIEATPVNGFINCAGIQSPGLTSSPAIAELVLKLLKELNCPFEEDPNYNPYRKPIITLTELKPLKEIQPLIDIASSPEKIICRCEQVDEATIIDAMNRGIPVTTVDGIKRRTRAGCGWCQGTFCRPRVVEVMERELGHEIDSSFDVEHSGVNRVGKNEIVDYINAHQD
ncbi:NAD(P)/FAD-dependent oxidoreductase [Acetobacterium woodii]|uniref:FAD dependend glycerol-3-phosphate dehydrogenase GlpA1 n=1 Tax=Acetobacterium woodii (strain ATCC 29683 / DSM 1030 / JCM 2381 / KCTC 1655 / WB1) TaxID=931626 RepID=H6LBX1_ACEWD|nr:NAD(P)/FAD-dependent oxidoreductase [Acetobacterium woodii]AFA47714.1 FAD dependend glycerol-3-phosphate dehydrogenase GlpA1 [Acetobacterium woodii DSM 1030]